MINQEKERKASKSIHMVFLTKGSMMILYFHLLDFCVHVNKFIVSFIWKFIASAKQGLWTSFFLSIFSNSNLLQFNWTVYNLFFGDLWMDLSDFWIFQFLHKTCQSFMLGNTLALCSTKKKSSIQGSTVLALNGNNLLSFFKKNSDSLGKGLEIKVILPIIQSISFWSEERNCRGNAWT